MDRKLLNRQKMDGPNPSNLDIKVSTPAPTYCLQFEKRLPYMEKFYISPLIRKIK